MAKTSYFSCRFFQCSTYVRKPLYNLQRQRTIIRFIEEKDKNRRYVESWSPIPLLNVDYKIGSNALAARLDKPEITHETQCAYVKGRSLFDGVRPINHVMNAQNSITFRVK